MKLPAAIFREYDIRGTVGDQLTPEVARAIGQAATTLAWDRLGRAPRLAVGRDNRPSGSALAEGLLSGIEAAGGHAADVGTLLCDSRPEGGRRRAGHRLAQPAGVQRLQARARRGGGVRSGTPGVATAHRGRTGP